jgi:hypothetical protein
VSAQIHVLVCAALEHRLTHGYLFAALTASLSCFAQASAEFCFPCAELALWTEYAKTTSLELISVDPAHPPTIYVLTQDDRLGKTEELVFTSTLTWMAQTV